MDLVKPSFLDSATTKRNQFRNILTRKSMTVMTGSFGPVYARMAEELGFEAFFVSGSHVSAFLFGVPDNGIIGLREMVDHSGRVASRVGIPVLADLDTGYGNAVNVHYAVQEFVRAGVAAVSIEDQEAPKKSSTGGGRRCVSLEEALGKYRAAIAARDELDPSMVVCARCDVLGSEGGTFEDALRRCTAYVERGGVDMVWLNSVESREQIARACVEIAAPIMVIWGGLDAPPSFAELDELGVKISLYANLPATFGLHAAWRHLGQFRKQGVAYLEQWKATEHSDVSFDNLVRGQEIAALERDFLPRSAHRDYDTTWGHSSLAMGDRVKPSTTKPD